MRSVASRPTTQSRTTAFLWALTACYLVFELAFNARLLDAVSSYSTTAQIHNLDQFGRLLSGVAVALVVLQLLLSRKSRATENRLNYAMIGLLCSIAGVTTFVLLQFFIDYLVETSSPRMRRSSAHILVVKQQIISGKAVLDGLNDEVAMPKLAEGKAFLALLPVMSLFAKDVDVKLQRAMPQLVRSEIERKIGGQEGYYKLFTQASQSVAGQWTKYSQAFGYEALQAEISRQQESAWSEYKEKLRSRGWTPTTIPRYARARVVNEVRINVPVPPDWHPADVLLFRQAMSTEVTKRFKVPASVQVDGQSIPTGLSYEAFFNEASIQSHLRSNLGLPPKIVLKANYAQAEEFIAKVYEPMLRNRIKEKLLLLDSPERSFAKGAANEQFGLDAVR